MLLTGTSNIDWVPLTIFALIVAIIVFVLGRVLFKKKPGYIFAIPGLLTLIGGVFMTIGIFTNSVEMIYFFFWGVLILLAAAGSVIGALIFFFIVHKKNQTKNIDEVPF